MRRSYDTFAIREWLAADADPRKADDKTLAEGVRCDDLGCVGRLADGRLIALSLGVGAFADDCARAFAVVSPRESPGDCRALLLDRKVWHERGAMSLQVADDRIDISAARPVGYDRPWAPAQRRSGVAIDDATPRIDQLEPGD